MFRRKRKTGDFSAEIESHIQHEGERLREQGMSEEEARAAAHRTFGNVMHAEERFFESGRVLWRDHLAQDIRFSLRTLARNPGFAAVAVLTLALGIAVNSTMFSLVSAFLLRKPPGREPQRVVVVSSVSPTAGFQSDANLISAPNYLAWREANQVFADTAAADPYRTANLTAQKESEALRCAAISTSYFSVLGIAPQLGRTFLSGEDHPGHDHVAILSHQLWERRFGSDPSVLSLTIRLNRENYDVVGVMPADSRLMGYPNEIWTPLVLNAADQTASAHNDRSLLMLARLKPGVTPEQARAEVVTLGRRAAEIFPESEKGWGATVRTLPDFLIYSFHIAPGVAILMTAVGFILLIACANVAGLLLAQATSRRKEVAIRLSLGAGRFRIVRQLLTEGLVISLAGGCAGVLLAHWGIKLVRASMTFNEAIGALSFRLDWNVVLFSLGVSILCALLCAVVPGWSAARTDVNSNLKDESRSASSGKGQSRLRTFLVTGEIALALFLLVGTGLLIHGIFLIDHQKLGFQTNHLLTATVTLDDAHYKGSTKQIEFAREILGRMERIPGADNVAIASDLPATGPGSVTLQIQGQPELPPNQELRALDFVVSPNLFQAAGIALLRGRTFTETDKSDSPHVVVVNQEFVRRNLQNQEPLGKQIRLDVSGETPAWSEIVGVVENVKGFSETTRDDPEVYEAFLQRPVLSFSLMVRTSADPNSLAAELRNAVAQVDAELPLARVLSMDAVIESQHGGDAFFAAALGTFAVLALLLAGIGIYGLISYSMGLRRHEIGIRMAMGARSTDVLRMVLWQAVRMAGIGAVIGIAMALPLPKVFDSMFYGIKTSEPRLYFAVPLAIFVVTILAAYVPARRVLTVDPMLTLRHE